MLVVVPDRLSDILVKGEFAPRYYNPANLFDDVHLVTTVADSPSLAALQRTVGRARLSVHALPFGARRYQRALRWVPAVLERWAQDGLRMAARIRPALVRCYGLDVNAYLAARITETLGVPSIISVHTARDESPDPVPPARRILARLFERIERRALQRASLVLPVYRGILPQLARQGARRVEVAYNVINGDHLAVKRDYALHHPVRILNVGRQLPHKNPAAIIESLTTLPDTELTVVGDGPLHESLRALAARAGLEDRVRFVRALPNDALCASLADYDLFAAQSDYCEIPKAVLEPLIAGLPVVMNRRRGPAVPELEGDHVYLVENTAAGYAAAFAALIADPRRRETLGERARAVSESQWAPVAAEARLADIYRRVAG